MRGFYLKRLPPAANRLLGRSAVSDSTGDLVVGAPTCLTELLKRLQYD
jgi:hypothetical protein